jgi:predicted ATPase
LLHSCPELRILATSREALGITGEVAWPVPSLSLPDLRRLPDIERLTRYESARLFLERVVAVKPSFALTEQNAPSVAQICYRLDGIPLAIELAAARVNVLPVEEIANRLDDCFRLLSAGSRTAMPRHRTLHATMDWSHELLPEEEQILFRRLSVFAGGFTLDAAEAVCAGEDLERDAVLDLLSHLVDKSLVMAREESGEARYRLLETIRQYGREKLSESGEAELFRERHAGYYLALAEEAEPELSGDRQGEWLQRLEAEHDNFRAALGFSLEGGDARLGLRLAGVLGGFWYKRGYLREGRW